MYHIQLFSLDKRQMYWIQLFWAQKIGSDTFVFHKKNGSDLFVFRQNIPDRNIWFMTAASCFCSGVLCSGDLSKNLKVFPPTILTFDLELEWTGVHDMCSSKCASAAQN